MAKEKKTIKDEGNYNPYEELANAVIIQACEDYKRAYACYLRNPESAERTKQQLEELEFFFRSDWYKTLTELDGEYLMQRLQEEVRSQQKKAKK